MKKKLIEVALPLDAINAAASAEKSPFVRRHPRALHVWWARRPLAACRAVLFASLVDDPSSHPEQFPTPKAIEDERERLFDILRRLVRWGSTTDERVLEEARAEIRRSTGGQLPAVVDPFSGGGSISLEAQRLGMEAYASDLNPVAVLITKALVEIPPKFADQPPVHPDARRGVGATGTWKRAGGLAADVRRYGLWIRDEAERRIGHVYPSVRLPIDLGGGDAIAVAWLWARTVMCPNPACHARMPLVRSFALSTKKGKEAWVEPIVDRVARTVSFEVRTGRGKPPAPPKVGRGANFRCLVCDQQSPDDHIKAEGRAGRMDTQLMAIVAEGQRGRVYLAPVPEHDAVARSTIPTWAPEEEIANDPRALWTLNYGLTRFRDLFTSRQLAVLATLTDLVAEARERVLTDAGRSVFPEDHRPLRAGGGGPAAYADAVATYLGLAISRITDFSNSIASWDAGNTNLRQLFARQAIPMSWDFAETNLLDGVVTVASGVDWVATTLEALPASVRAEAVLADATAMAAPRNSLVSTDPPYYDNIGYADLSDFFYVWLRRSLGPIHPDLFATVLTPKSAELVATPYRHGGSKKRAEQHFQQGLGVAFERIRAVADPELPITLFYAFKQTETEGDGADTAIVSTGWETMLTGLLQAGFVVDGTWPMRTEQLQRSIASGTNALATSIVLSCRPRSENATITDRRGLLAALKAELPEAVRTLQRGNIAPVDLRQAAIGPGMAVFSRYARVVEPDGRAMTVRTGMGLINQVLGETLHEQEDQFDPDTRWAVEWFSEHAFERGPQDRGAVLARAMGVGMNGLEQAGIALSRAGKTWLVRRENLDPSWDPTLDKRPTVWELTQHLIRLRRENGEAAAAGLVRKVGGLGDTARDLAYRLSDISLRQGWAAEALAYNELVTSWPEITRLAALAPTEPEQASLFG